ncbi:hypothetical protein C8Q74DRAFT_1255718 [Fomes fomentarius]|nr:hypothetical protein C8Q74DRAFT_1255718 [Fomes fomentarius]
MHSGARQCIPTHISVASLGGRYYALSPVMLLNTDLNGTIGVLFLGAVFSSMIYGLTCLQTFQYFRSHRAASDGRCIHLLVLLLLALDTFHQALILHVDYTYLVLGFANPIKLLSSLPWTGPVEILVNGTLGFIFNVFNIYRLWRLCNNVYVVTPALLLSLANYASGISYAIRMFQCQNMSQAMEKLKDHGLAQLALSATTDILVSAALGYYLYKSRTGVRRSKDMIGKLIIMTVTTGAFCATWNIAAVIVYVAAPQTLAAVFFTFIMSKLYANAVLTTLNMRQYMRTLGGASGDTAQGISLPERNHSLVTVCPRDADNMFVIHIDSARTQTSNIASPPSEGKLEGQVFEDV